MHARVILIIKKIKISERRRGKLPSKVYLFCQYEWTHDGYNDHHQRAKSSSKNWTFFLYHQSLDIVWDAWCHYPLNIGKEGKNRAEETKLSHFPRHNSKKKSVYRERENYSIGSSKEVHVPANSPNRALVLHRKCHSNSL